jgi:hypothetical protein
MADEFAKGLGILTAAGLAWMVLAGWYNTPTFEAAEYPQLLAPNPEGLATFGTLAVSLKSVVFWFAVSGALLFWVVVPAVREAREAGGE